MHSPKSRAAALLKRILDSGVTPETPADEIGHLRLTNALLLCMSVGSLLVTGSLFVGGAYPAAFLNLTAPITFGGGIYIMSKGYTMVARMFVLMLAYLAAYVLATMLGRDAQIQLIILFCGAQSFTFFPPDRWRYIVYGLVLPLWMFLLLELTHYQPVLGLERAQLSPYQLEVIRICAVSAVWILILVQYAYYMRARRRAQVQLISSAKMVSLGHMAAGIAHEVNNPLTQIMGLTERLTLQAGSGSVPSEQVLAATDKIQGICMRIGSIVHGLMVLSREASGDPFVTLSLRSLVSLTLDYCSERVRSHGVRLHVSELPEQWTVIGREAQLSEVLLNLMNNALDATRESADRWIEIDAQAKPDFIEIALTDSGPGVPAAVRQKIFDPFFTTKPIGRGTGLGLSISRGIMVAHGGWLVHDNDSPRTRFVMRVPRGKDA